MHFSRGWGVCCAVASGTRCVLEWLCMSWRSLQLPSQPEHFKKQRDGYFSRTWKNPVQEGPLPGWRELSVSFKWTHTVLRHVPFHVPQGIFWKWREMGVLTSKESMYVWLTDNNGTYFWDTVWDDDQVWAINIPITLIICHFLVVFCSTHQENCISVFSSPLSLSSSDPCHSVFLQSLLSILPPPWSVSRFTGNFHRQWAKGNGQVLRVALMGKQSLDSTQNTTECICRTTFEFMGFSMCRDLCAPGTLWGKWPRLSVTWQAPSHKAV